MIIASGAVAIQDWPAKPVWAVMAAAVNLVISLPILPARWAGPVIAVGKSVTHYLWECAPAARIDNAADVDNQEQDAPLSVRAGPKQPWSAEWPHVRHIG